MSNKDDILDLKRITMNIAILMFVVILIALAPLYIYYKNFKDYELSTNPSDWALFSTYISGTSGVLLSFFAVTFALISIYFTTKIAKSIQKRDIDFSKEQSRSELKLIHSQNKPYPYLDLVRFPNETSITLQNKGLGTLIVKNVKIRYKDSEDFDTFVNLFDTKLQIDNTDDCKLILNTAPNHVLSPNGDKVMFKIIPLTDENKNYKKIQSNFRKILKDCEVRLEYADIFNNEFHYSKELSFLK